MIVYNKGLLRAGALLFVVSLCLLLFSKSIQEGYLFTPMILGLILFALGFKKPGKIR